MPARLDFRKLRKILTLQVSANAPQGASQNLFPRYLHRSLDKHPPPEELLRHDKLRLDTVWRMGPLRFVWAAVLRRT